MVVRELLTKLGFEADQSKIDKFENSVGNLTKGLALLVTGATAAATAAFGFAKSAASYGDEVAKSARVIGLTTEELQSYRFAFDRAGISQGELSSSLEIFNKLLGSAQEGTGAASDTLKQLGISLTDANGKFRGTSQLMPEILDALKGIDNEATRARIATDLFGRSGIRMGTAFANGSEELRELLKEAEELGGVMTDEDAKKAEAFTDALTNVNLAFKGIQNRLGVAFFDTFTKLITTFTDLIKANKEIIDSNLKSFFDGAIWVVNQFIRVLGTLFGWIDKVAQLMGGWSNTIKIVGIAIGVLMALKFIPWVIAATAAIKALNIAMLLNPAGLITAAIVALGTAIILLIEDIYQWVAGNESAIGDLLGSWEDFKNKFIGYITGAVDYVKNKFNEVSESISGAFNSAIESVKGYFKGLFDDVTAFVDKIIGVFTSLKDKVSNIFGSVKDSIKSGLNAVLPEAITTSLGINTNSEDNQKEANIVNNLTEQQKQEIYNKINLDDSLVNSIRPQSETVTPTIPSVLGSTNNTSSVINDNKNINITVPPGTTTEQVEAIKNEINKTMQQQYTDAVQHLEGY